MPPRFRKACHRIDVTGIVQGIGFRPFVYHLAEEFELPGFVLNHGRGVTIEVEGALHVVDAFVHELSERAPAAARIDSIVRTDGQWKGYTTFEIRESKAGAASGKYVAISPDLALCPDCRGEIHDPRDRRYCYPFTNCTKCGPRFTIVREVPYDRISTTMAGFKMCAACQAEYDDPSDRRFHAQPNACPQCGPKLWLTNARGEAIQVPVYFNANKAVLDRCAQLLRQGSVVAIKGIGGFHLACDARNSTAVAALRSRKVREGKPFAVMFPDLAQLRQSAEVSPAEEEVLTSRQAPIVLLNMVHPLARGIDPSADAKGEPNRVGALLPYTPLHELLLRSFGGPLVMTSGNLSDEPIVTRNDDAVSRLGNIADAFLLHDREIEVRCDDSVVRVGYEPTGPVFYRRSRGYAPASFRLATASEASVLAVGAELKNVFCLTRGTEAVLSHHIGDLENLQTLESFEAGIRHFEKLFNARPEAIAHDLHPEYLSTQWVQKAQEKAPDSRVIGVQHHHAHIAACLEDNGAGEEPVLGIALDGTGFGPDETIWGGELLLADRASYRRIGHLRPSRLPGGQQAIRQPWRSALAYLAASAGSSAELERLVNLCRPTLLAGVPPEHAQVVLHLISKNTHTYPTTSCGRLFDSVAALCGIATRIEYEAEAAIELEQLATMQRKRGAKPTGRGYAFNVTSEESIELDWRPVIHGIVDDLTAGVDVPSIGLKFHEALVQAWAQAAEVAAREHRIDTVALSGGCFLNDLLREGLWKELSARGLKPLFHRQIPTNDGGIAFGQAVVAHAQLQRAKFRQNRPADGHQ